MTTTWTNVLNGAATTVGATPGDAVSATLLADVLKISNSGTGIDATLRDVGDGDGTTLPLKVSTSAVMLPHAAIWPYGDSTFFSAGQTGILIPYYIYPNNPYSDATCARLLGLIRQYRGRVPVIVVLNPGSGPGSVMDGNYSAFIKLIQAAGGKVAGYVSTAYAGTINPARTEAAVKADVDTWLTLYADTPIDTIFYDEMNYALGTNNEYVALYKRYTDYCHARNLAPVIANPGTNQQGAWFAERTADIIVVAETGTWPTESDMLGAYIGGHIDYKTSLRAALVYGQSSLTPGKVRQLAQYVQWIYATADALSPNPWDSLSGYLEQLFAILADREEFNVKNFGAVGDGVADDTAAFSAMFAAVEAVSGGAMAVPPGTYSIPNGFISGGTNALLPQCDNWSLKGAGRDLTVFKWGDGSDLFRRFSTDARISNVEMSGFSITGTWQTAQNDSGNYAFRLYGIDNVNIQDVGVRDVRNIAIVLRLCSGQVKDIDLLRVARDGVSVGTCRYMRVTNLRGEHVDDDLIGAHNTSDAGDPVPSVIEISNVTGIDTGRVSIQGACRVVASNIQLFRPREGGFSVNWSGSEGYNGVLSVQVDGLVVNDVLNRNGIDGLSSNCNYITVASRTKNAGVLAAAPGYPLAATGATVSSYAYLDANSLTSPRGTGRHVRVTNFQCVRTLETVTHYSDWGYGTMFTRAGFLDPAITVAEIGAGRGIQLGNSGGSALEDVHIDNGTFSGHDHAIYFSGGDFKGILIGAGVNCRNFKSGGLTLNSGAIGAFENVIVRARFNGDPERQHASRAVANTGQWQNIATPIAINVDTTSGLVIEGCHVANVSTVVSGTGASFVRGVLLYADPTGTAYNAGNFGIGNCPVPTPANDYWYVIQDGDPTSATFGTIKNYCAQSSTAQPATGKYVKGMLILAKQPTVSATGLTRGWYRNTTGTGHTTGSTGDWQEVRDNFGDTATYSSSLRLKGSASGVAEVEAYGGATNIDVQLTPKGTTGKVKAVLANVPTYADDAAAGVGGLTAGHVYKTSTGVLMIKL